MSIALNNWNNQLTDSNGNSLWRKVSQYEKDRNWVILWPFTHMENGVERAYQTNIKKPYFARILNPVDDVANRLISGDTRTGTQQALDAINSVSPMQSHLEEGRLGASATSSVLSAVHPLPKTAIEQFANVNDFGRPIVPSKEQGIDLRYQVGSTTGTVAQTMGEGGWKGAAAGGTTGAIIGGLFGGAKGAAVGGGIGITVGARGASPRRIEAGLHSLFATGASQTESYLNPFFDGTNQTKDNSAYGIARDFPVVGPLVRNITGGQGDQSMVSRQNQFYTMAQQAQVPLNTVEFLRANKPAEVESYMRQHSNELSIGGVASHLQEKIGRIDKAIQEVQNDTTLSNESLNSQLQTLYDIKKQILDVGINMMRSSPQVGQAAAFPGQGQGAPR